MEGILEKNLVFKALKNNKLCEVKLKTSQKNDEKIWRIKKKLYLCTTIEKQIVDRKRNKVIQL